MGGCFNGEEARKGACCKREEESGDCEDILSWSVRCVYVSDAPGELRISMQVHDIATWNIEVKYHESDSQSRDDRLYVPIRSHRHNGDI